MSRGGREEGGGGQEGGIQERGILRIGREGVQKVKGHYNTSIQHIYVTQYRQTPGTSVYYFVVLGHLGASRP